MPLLQRLVRRRSNDCLYMFLGMSRRKKKESNEKVILYQQKETSKKNIP